MLLPVYEIQHVFRGQSHDSQQGRAERGLPHRRGCWWLFCASTFPPFHVAKRLVLFSMGVFKEMSSSTPTPWFCPMVQTLLPAWRWLQAVVLGGWVMASYILWIFCRCATNFSTFDLYLFGYAGSWTSLVAQMVKRLPTMQEIQVQSLGWEDLLEEEMAPHSSTLAWKIPWMEEPGRLQSMGSQRVRHDWAERLHFHFHATF